MLKLGSRVWFTSQSQNGRGVPGTWETGTLVAERTVLSDANGALVILGSGSLIELA